MYKFATEDDIIHSTSGETGTLAIPCVILNVEFGIPASNDLIVKFVVANAPEIMGKVLLINGSASLPVAMVLAHKYAHLVPAIGCFDPKLDTYVICITHSPQLMVGDLISSLESQIQ